MSVNTNQLRVMASLIEAFPLDSDPVASATILSAAADELDQLRDKLNRIRTLCQQNNHPGVNVGAHELAGKVLKVIEE